MRAFKKELTMLAVMIALAIITAVLNPLFLGGDNLRNNIRHISLISLFALGEAMVIIAGGIDLSIGSVICIIGGHHQLPRDVRAASASAPRWRSRSASRWWWASLQGLIIARVGIPPFVVTLGSMLLLRGVAEVLTGGTDVGFQGEVPGLPRLGKGRRWGCRCRSGSRPRRSSGRVPHAPHAASGATATRSAPTPRRRGCRASRS